MHEKKLRPVAQDKQVCEFLSGSIMDLPLTTVHAHSGQPPHFLSVLIMQFIFRSGISGYTFNTMLPPAAPIIICDCVDYAPFRTSAIFTRPVRAFFTAHSIPHWLSLVCSLSAFNSLSKRMERSATVHGSLNFTLLWCGTFCSQSFKMFHKSG